MNSSDIPRASVLGFGVFELDCRTGELRESGELVRLPPQPFKILVLLASQAGQIVTREEICRQIWGDTTHVDFERGLNQCVSQIRAAIGDDVETPRFVETLPRRGYRFICPVATTRRTVPQPKIESIAVLPLENLSGDPEQEYFVDGMAEELTTNLGKIRALRVISRTSMKHYKGTRKTLPEIARELNVDALIEGTVLRSGTRVRITANLLHAPSDRHLWAESYYRNLDDAITIQGEVARAIAREIEINLTPQEQARLARPHPVQLEAYEDYLKGRFYLNKFTPEGFQKGLAYLNQAIEKDPADPSSYAALALAYCLMGHEAFPEILERAKAPALKALELDENLAEAHEALAEYKLYYEWEFPGAEQAFLRVFTLNPSLPEAHAHYAWFQMLAGRRSEAIAGMKRARDLDPLTPLWTMWLGWHYWICGERDKAIAQARKSLELDPNFPWGLYVLGVVYAEKGMFEEAIAAHQKAASNSPALRYALGRTYALAGRSEEARKIAAEVAKNPQPLEAWGLAEINTALGEKDEAFRWLETAYERRLSWMPWLEEVAAPLVFDPLRSDPRFQDILRRMNFPTRDGNSGP